MIFSEIKEFLVLRAQELREQGVTGPLKVVPVQGIRCFAPCYPGLCICRNDADGYCVVSEAGMKKAIEHIASGIDYMSEIVEKE